MKSLKILLAAVLVSGTMSAFGQSCAGKGGAAVGQLPMKEHLAFYEKELSFDEGQLSKAKAILTEWETTKKTITTGDEVASIDRKADAQLLELMNKEQLAKYEGLKKSGKAVACCASDKSAAKPACCAGGKHAESKTASPAAKTIQ